MWKTHPTDGQLKRCCRFVGTSAPWSTAEKYEQFAKLNGSESPKRQIQRQSNTYFSGLWHTVHDNKTSASFLINWNYIIRKLPRVYWYIISVRHIQHIFEDGFTSTQLHFPRTNRDNVWFASRNEKVSFMNCTLKYNSLKREKKCHIWKESYIHIHAQNLTCHLKRDHFERKLHLNQASIFRGHVLMVFGGAEGGGYMLKKSKVPWLLSNNKGVPLPKTATTKFTKTESQASNPHPESRLRCMAT